MRTETVDTDGLLDKCYCGATAKFVSEGSRHWGSLYRMCRHISVQRTRCLETLK